MIELLIVVAILGLIAYIAIPIYKDYVDRTKVTEALSLVESAKKAMVEYHGLNGSFPESDDELNEVLSLAGIESPFSQTAYVKRIQIKKIRRFIPTGIRLTLRERDDSGNQYRWGPKAILFWKPHTQGGTITWTCCWNGFRKWDDNQGTFVDLGANETPSYIEKFCPKKKSDGQCSP